VPTSGQAVLARNAAAARPAERIILALAVAVCTVLGLSAPASAATFVVNTTADPTGASCPTTCSLRAAIIAADSAGVASTITLPAGTYTLTIPPSSAATNPKDDPASGDLDVDNGAQVTIDGAGPALTIIDANRIDAAFAVHPGASLSLAGLTVQHGDSLATGPSSNSSGAGDGGAIYNEGALQITNSILTNNYADTSGGAVFAGSSATSTSITNSVVSHNSAGTGGGLYIGAGSVKLSGDTLSDNAASGGGGFIEELLPIGSPPVTVASSMVQGNSAGGQGGAFLLSGTGPVTVTNSSISNNSTSSDQPGGGIYVSGGGRLTVSTSTFENDSSGSGGAIYTLANDLNVASSTFTADNAGVGGAVYVDGNSAIASESIVSSTFTGNHANASNGGAIAVALGALTVAASTFSENLGSQDGGALYYASSDALSLVNDTFDSNQAPRGGAIDLSTSAGSGQISLLNDTVARNTALQGGGIYQANLAGRIENTIIADNTGDPSHGGGDCYDTTGFGAGGADAGHNLDSDGTCFGTPANPSIPLLASDRTQVDPMLAPLADNGGLVNTDALVAGSAAVGHANSADCPASDARGVPRPLSGCDIGAFQSSPADLALTASGPARGTVGTPIIDTFTITNNGPGAATGVTFTSSLPTGSTFFGASSSQGTCSGTTSVTCAIGSIGATQTGGAQPVTVTVIWLPQKVGTLTDSARVSASQNDPNASNNSAAAATRISYPTFGAPLLLTGPVTALGTRAATVSGVIGPGATGSVRYHFDFGRTRRYGQSTSARKLAHPGSVHVVHVKIHRLAPGARYHYRLVVTSLAGTSRGQDATFRTLR
jgi:CSLREA domain-containing protein/uncharacterized repeat protein (TIGR01451 family)